MSVTHGRAGTYRSRTSRCRCGPCTAAHRERQQRETEDRARRLAADPSLAPHGSAHTYMNWRCRCVPCTEAHSTRCREYKASVAARRTS